MSVADLALKKLARELAFRDSPRFSVVVDDPDAETWAVKFTRYVDAERGGFCGDVSETLFSDLGQLEAINTVSTLEELVAQVREEAR
jgi:hypothetical protein